MIKDLYLLLDIELLLHKKIIVWGIGENGKILIEQLIQAGISDKNLLLCDSDERKQGKKYKGWNIFSPEHIVPVVNSSEYAIVISPINPETQDSILSSAASLNIDILDCYTEWCVKRAICFYRKKAKDNYVQESHEMMLIRQDCRALNWFMFAPLYEERFLIYQPGKVGSTSVYQSLIGINKYAFHTHCLNRLEIGAEKMRSLCEKMGGLKIITMVREPIMQMLSGMWENFDQTWRYSENVNFREIQNYFFGKDFYLYESEWFNTELKAVFGIDVFAYPFDREKGYVIIEERGISILLMTMEKMNELEDVIGKFTGIKKFQLDQKNIGSKKAYRFAYSEYKKIVRFSRELLDQIYLVIVKKCVVNSKLN